MHTFELNSHFENFHKCSQIIDLKRISSVIQSKKNTPIVLHSASSIGMKAASILAKSKVRPRGMCAPLGIKFLRRGTALAGYRFLHEGVFVEGDLSCASDLFYFANFSILQAACRGDIGAAEISHVDWFKLKDTALNFGWIDIADQDFSAALPQNEVPDLSIEVASMEQKNQLVQITEASYFRENFGRICHLKSEVLFRDEELKYLLRVMPFRYVEVSYV